MFNFSNGRDEARRRPRAAMVADGDSRRGRWIGWYLRVQYVLPRRWVVVVVADEHHIDGAWKRDEAKACMLANLTQLRGSPWR